MKNMQYKDFIELLLSRRLSFRDGDQPPAKRFAGLSGPGNRLFGGRAGGGQLPGSDGRLPQETNNYGPGARRESMGEDKEEDQNKVVQS